MMSKGRHPCCPAAAGWCGFIRHKRGGGLQLGLLVSPLQVLPPSMGWSGWICSCAARVPGALYRGWFVAQDDVTQTGRHRLTPDFEPCGQALRLL